MMKRFPEGKELTPHNKEYRANARKYYGMIRELSARYKDKEYGRTLLTKYDDVKAMKCMCRETPCRQIKRVPL